MSTGAECCFYVKDERWFYDIQQWPYGETPDYDTFGPFEHYGQARDHLDRNHANPGGWSTDTSDAMQRKCKHERRVDGVSECYHCAKWLGGSDDY